MRYLGLILMMSAFVVLSIFATIAAILTSLVGGSFFYVAVYANLSSGCCAMAWFVNEIAKNELEYRYH